MSSYPKLGERILIVDDYSERRFEVLWRVCRAINNAYCGYTPEEARDLKEAKECVIKYPTLAMLVVTSLPFYKHLISGEDASVESVSYILTYDPMEDPEEIAHRFCEYLDKHSHSSPTGSVS